MIYKSQDIDNHHRRKLFEQTFVGRFVLDHAFNEITKTFNTCQTLWIDSDLAGALTWKPLCQIVKRHMVSGADHDWITSDWFLIMKRTCLEVFQRLILLIII